MSRPLCTATVSMGRYGKRTCGDPATLLVAGRPRCTRCAKSEPYGAERVKIAAPRVTLAQINAALERAGCSERLVREVAQGITIEGPVATLADEWTLGRGSVGPDRDRLDALTVDEWVAAVVAHVAERQAAVRSAQRDEALRAQAPTPATSMRVHATACDMGADCSCGVGTDVEALAETSGAMPMLEPPLDAEDDDAADRCAACGDPYTDGSPGCRSLVASDLCEWCYVNGEG